MFTAARCGAHDAAGRAFEMHRLSHQPLWTKTVGHHIERPLLNHRKAQGARARQSRVHDLLETVGLTPPEEVARMHDQAHHACFIASSVKTEVVVEPQ